MPGPIPPLLPLAEWLGLPPRRRPSTVPSFPPALCHRDLSPPQKGVRTCSAPHSAAGLALSGWVSWQQVQGSHRGETVLTKRQGESSRVLQAVKTGLGVPGQGTPQQWSRGVSGGGRPGWSFSRGLRAPGCQGQEAPCAAALGLEQAGEWVGGQLQQPSRRLC